MHGDHSNIKVLLDFFKKSRSPEAAPLVAPRKARNSPVVPSAIRRWRNLRPQAMVPAAAPCGGGRWGPYTLGGIQYCTSVRWGEYVQEGRRPPPATGWGRRPYGFAVGVAPSADGALERLGDFARCGGREFRALRGATKGSAFGNRDFLKKIE